MDKSEEVIKLEWHNLNLLKRIALYSFFICVPFTLHQDFSKAFSNPWEGVIDGRSSGHYPLS